MLAEQLQHACLPDASYMSCHFLLLEWMTLTTVCEYYKLLTAHYAYVYGLLGVDVVSFVDKLHLMRSRSISAVPAARRHIPISHNIVMFLFPH